MLHSESSGFRYTRLQRSRHGEILRAYRWADAAGELAVGRAEDVVSLQVLFDVRDGASGLSRSSGTAISTACRVQIESGMGTYLAADERWSGDKAAEFDEVRGMRVGGVA
jgi:hypothetical protein